MRKVVFGIQGGEGSFNQEALIEYTTSKNIVNFKTIFLYTSEAVLFGLDKREIDFGIFAIHNSAGGMVEESLLAMAKHIFVVEDSFSILIRHFLMKRRDADFDEIRQIMAHPQVLKQCRLSLALKYTGFDLISGQGDLIDTACAAKNLAMGEMNKNIAILGPRALSDLFDLEIIDMDLQDCRDNMTSFLVVKGI